MSMPPLAQRRTRAAICATPDSLPARIGRMRFDALTLFGLFAVTAMLLCYAFERKGRQYILGFSVACLLGSVYGFLQGAWPFGLVEAIWAFVALKRWKQSV